MTIVTYTLELHYPANETMQRFEVQTLNANTHTLDDARDAAQALVNLYGGQCDVYATDINNHATAIAAIR